MYENQISFFSPKAHIIYNNLIKCNIKNINKYYIKNKIKTI